MFIAVKKQNPNAGNSHVADCRSQQVPEDDFGHFCQRTSMPRIPIDCRLLVARYDFLLVSYNDLRFRWKRCWVIRKRISCSSTDSEQQHRCRHLPNNFGSRQIFPLLHNGPPLFPETIPSHGGSGSHLIHGLCAHPSPHPKRHLDWFSRFSTAHGCDQLTHRHNRCTTLHL